jgi:membrane protein
MIRRFHLRGSAADAVQSLFARPPEAGGALTFVGAVVLLASLLSFTKLLQGTWESAWELPSLGLRAAGIGFAGVGLLVLEALLLSLIATALGGTPRAVVTLIRGAAAVPFFLGLQLALLSGRANWRSLLPGTLVLAVGQAVFTLGSALWMPRLVEHNASRYGVVGVTLALLSWLIVLGILLVAGAAVSAELAHSRAPSVGSVAPADGAAGDADRGTPVRPRPPDPRQDVEEQSLR